MPDGRYSRQCQGALNESSEPHDCLARFGSVVPCTFHPFNSLGSLEVFIPFTLISPLTLTFANTAQVALQDPHSLPPFNTLAPHIDEGMMYLPTVSRMMLWCSPHRTNNGATVFFPHTAAYAQGPPTCLQIYFLSIRRSDQGAGRVTKLHRVQNQPQYNHDAKFSLVPLCLLYLSHEAFQLGRNREDLARPSGSLLSWRRCEHGVRGVVSWDLLL